MATSLDPTYAVVVECLVRPSEFKVADFRVLSEEKLENGHYRATVVCLRSALTKLWLDGKILDLE